MATGSYQKRLDMADEAAAACRQSLPDGQPGRDGAGLVGGSAAKARPIHPWRLSPRQWTMASLVALLIFWETASRSQLISPIFFPAPAKVLLTLVRLAQSAEMWNHLATTMIRLWGGVLLGSVPAIMLGLFMGWSPWLRKAADPILALAHPIPKVAVFPLIMVIFGIGDFSRVVVVALAVFFPYVINTLAGAQQIDRSYFELAAIYNARPLKVLTQVILPGSLPMILAGLRIAVNLGLVVTISVEMVASQVGLGNWIWMSWEIMRIDQLYAAITLVALLGLLFNLLVNLLHRRLIPWRPEQQAM